MDVLQACVDAQQEGFVVSVSRAVLPGMVLPITVKTSGEKIGVLDWSGSTLIVTLQTLAHVRLKFNARKFEQLNISAEGALTLQGIVVVQKECEISAKSLVLSRMFRWRGDDGRIKEIPTRFEAANMLVATMGDMFINAGTVKINGDHSTFVACPGHVLMDTSFLHDDEQDVADIVISGHDGVTLNQTFYTASANFSVSSAGHVALNAFITNIKAKFGRFYVTADSASVKGAIVGFDDFKCDVDQSLVVAGMVFTEQSRVHATEWTIDEEAIWQVKKICQSKAKKLMIHDGGIVYSYQDILIDGQTFVNKGQIESEKSIQATLDGKFSNTLTGQLQTRKLQVLSSVFWNMGYQDTTQANITSPFFAQLGLHVSQSRNVQSVLSVEALGAYLLKISSIKDLFRPSHLATGVLFLMSSVFPREAVMFRSGAALFRCASTLKNSFRHLVWPLLKGHPSELRSAYVAEFFAGVGGGAPAMFSLLASHQLDDLKHLVNRHKVSAAIKEAKSFWSGIKHGHRGFSEKATTVARAAGLVLSPKDRVDSAVMLGANTNLAASVQHQSFLDLHTGVSANGIAYQNQSVIDFEGGAVAAGLQVGLSGSNLTQAGVVASGEKIQVQATERFHGIGLMHGKSISIDSPEIDLNDALRARYTVVLHADHLKTRQQINGKRVLVLVQSLDANNQIHAQVLALRLHDKNVDELDAIINDREHYDADTLVLQTDQALDFTHEEHYGRSVSIRAPSMTIEADIEAPNLALHATKGDIDVIAAVVLADGELQLFATGDVTLQELTSVVKDPEYDLFMASRLHALHELAKDMIHTVHDPAILLAKHVLVHAQGSLNVHSSMIHSEGDNDLSAGEINMEGSFDIVQHTKTHHGFFSKQTETYDELINHPSFVSSEHGSNRITATQYGIEISNTILKALEGLNILQAPDDVELKRRLLHLRRSSRKSTLISRHSHNEDHETSLPVVLMDNGTVIRSFNGSLVFDDTEFHSTGDGVFEALAGSVNVSNSLLQHHVSDHYSGFNISNPFRQITNLFSGGVPSINVGYEQRDANLAMQTLADGAMQYGGDLSISARDIGFNRYGVSANSVNLFADAVSLRGAVIESTMEAHSSGISVGVSPAGLAVGVSYMQMNGSAQVVVPMVIAAHCLSIHTQSLDQVDTQYAVAEQDIRADSITETHHEGFSHVRQFGFSFNSSGNVGLMLDGASIGFGQNGITSVGLRGYAIGFQEGAVSFSTPVIAVTASASGWVMNRLRIAGHMLDFDMMQGVLISVVKGIDWLEQHGILPSITPATVHTVFAPAHHVSEDPEAVTYPVPEDGKFEEIPPGDEDESADEEKRDPRTSYALKNAKNLSHMKHEGIQVARSVSKALHHGGSVLEATEFGIDLRENYERYHANPLSERIRRTAVATAAGVSFDTWVPWCFGLAGKGIQFFLMMAALSDNPESRARLIKTSHDILDEPKGAYGNMFADALTRSDARRVEVLAEMPVVMMHLYESTRQAFRDKFVLWSDELSDVLGH